MCLFLEMHPPNDVPVLTLILHALAYNVHECLGVLEKNKINLLLETLVVTAVTDAREMVSGSNDPARRIAFLSRSSMSRIAGSSGQLKWRNSTLGECCLCLFIPSVFYVQCLKLSAL